MLLMLLALAGILTLSSVAAVPNPHRPPECTKFCPCIDCDQDSGAKCRHIAGTLEIDTHAHSVSLPCLERVGRDVKITGQKKLESVALPGLRVIGHDLLVVSNGKLADFVVPSLKKIGKFLRMSDNGVKDLEFPSLESVGEGVLYSDSGR